MENNPDETLEERYKSFQTEYEIFDKRTEDMIQHPKKYCVEDVHKVAKEIKVLIDLIEATNKETELLNRMWEKKNEE